MNDLKLLGLQRAEFQRAEKMSSRCSLLQFVIVLISITNIFITIPRAGYLLAILSLLVSLAWVYFLYQTKHSHRTAERARRAIVFRNGLGIKLSNKSYSDLKMLFKVDENDAKKYEDKSYFKTTGDYGYHKLARIVEESSFWSKHLFKISATRYWTYFAIALAISIIGLLALPIIDTGNMHFLTSQVFCIVLLWLVSGDLFSTALSFTNASNSANDIESKLSNISKNFEPDQDTLLIVSDYNALVESSPTISSNVYQKYRDKLNKLWIDRNSL